MDKKKWTLWTMFRRILPLAKKDILMAGAAALLECVCSVGIMFFSQQLFDGIMDGIGVDTVLYIAGVCLSMLGLQVFLAVNNYFGEKMALKCKQGMLDIIAGEVSVISPENYESVSFQNELNVAKKSVEAIDLLTKMGLMFTCFYLPYYILVGIYMFSIHHLLLLVLLLIFVPTVLSQRIKFRMYYKARKAESEPQRRSEHYAECIYKREYAKETRNARGTGYFLGIWKEALRDCLKLKKRTERKAAFLELLLKVVTLVGYMGVLVILVTLASKGEISVGALAAIFNAVGTMFIYLEELFGYYLGELSRKMPDIRLYLEFLNHCGKLEPMRRHPVGGGFSMEHVSYRYPGQAKNALEDICLTVRKGELLAIVGTNGSGKTTLSHLILGLLKPVEGKIIFENEKDTVPGERKASALFQHFQRYRMTLRENVRISDSGCSADDGRVEECLKKADVQIHPEEMLSPEYGGKDLSGGQWQKTAMARAIYPDYGFLMLDEPTAAIDPMEETKMYERFREWANGNTAVLVTHRVGAAKIADNILVLEKGRVVEYGSFDELMERKEKFYEMFVSQSKWYAS